MEGVQRFIAAYLAAIPVSYFILVFIHFDKEKKEMPLSRKQQILQTLLYQLVIILFYLISHLKL